MIYFLAIWIIGWLLTSACWLQARHADYCRQFRCPAVWPQHRVDFIRRRLKETVVLSVCWPLPAWQAVRSYFEEKPEEQEPSDPS